MNAYKKLINFLEKSNSKFETNLYKSGGYFEVTNSTGKVHDVGFVSLLSTFQDLLKNYELLRKYITLCNPEGRTPDTAHANLLFKQARSHTSHKLDNIWTYHEKPLRLISENFFTNDRAKVVGAEQTKLLFSILSKIIACSNGINDETLDESIIFTQDSLNNAIKFLTQLMDEYTVKPQQNEYPKNLSSHKGINTIYYGAPGTGKSYQIDQRIKGASHRRTVFHADTQNSDFVGMLKPYSSDDGFGYKFTPGPFTLSYINAIKNPDTHHYLIIEELNRAQAAMVFGELFQLLDRDENGVGCYEIEPADQSLISYLKTELTISENDTVKLRMPGNLSIFATMNSSDQAVMPLDTAFKRRWNFEYIQIDMTNAPEGNIDIPINGNKMSVTWKKLASEINNLLTSKGIPEDRHLGPFFLSKNEINEGGLKNKLFIYLWDDLLRHQVKDILFTSDIKTFGQLIQHVNNNLDIFCPALQDNLSEKS